MANILVTGATGLLGSTLVPLLSARGHTVLRHGHSGAADLRADLRDWGQSAAMLDAAAPDCIINLAALTNVDACETDPHSAYQLNVASVEHLCRWMRASGRADCHLVQISSDQVYDGTGPHSENAVCIRNTYAFSKIAAEIAAAGVSSTILRTNFFGRSARAGRNSFSDWLYGALFAGTALTVFDDVLFSPLAIGTLCTMIEAVIVRRPRGVFNLGARDGLSKADFAFAFAAALSLSTDAMRRGRSDAAVALNAYRPKDMRLDSGRFEQVMDLRLPTLIDEITSMRSDYLEPA